MPVTLKQGELLDYPYLWHRQQQRGETEGRKTRPVCLAVCIQKADTTHLIFLAVTGTPPGKGRIAVEIPQIEARRGGLAGWKQGWVIVDEFNHDIAGNSFHLDLSQAPRGRFSEAFLRKVKEAFRAGLERGITRQVERSGE